MQNSDLIPALAGHALEVVASAFVGFVAWAARTSLKNISLQIMAMNRQFAVELKSLKHEFRAELSDSELRFYQRINGSYTRSESHRDLQSRVARLERYEDNREGHEERPGH